MRPAQVLEEKAALIDYASSQAYGNYLEQFSASMFRERGQYEGSIVSQQFSHDLQRTIVNGLRVGEAYHVQADMTPVVYAAALDLEGTSYLTRSMLPSDHGFLILDEPWKSKDVWDKTVTTKAIQWYHGGSYHVDKTGKESVVAPGLWVVEYSDVYDPEDDYSIKYQEELDQRKSVNVLGHLHVSHAQFIPYEARVGPIEYVTPEDYSEAVTGQKMLPSTLNPSRRMLALFLLLNQTITEIRDEPLNRTERRRAVRARIPAQVQTVTLRKKVTKYLNPGEGGGPVDWQHQWLVRGHWPWRHCGPEHPNAVPYEGGWHCQVYVAPYWKGPEGKPLLITDKVFDLAR